MLKIYKNGLYTCIQKFGVSKIVFYANQGCIYLIKIL